MDVSKDEIIELIEILRKLRQIEFGIIHKQSRDELLELASECDFRLSNLMSFRNLGLGIEAVPENSWRYYIPGGNYKMDEDK